jgi:hypothetical protein
MPQYSSPEPDSRWGVLTRTGGGTPMGDLLRRYWWPIAGASELERPGTLAVRLMGEDLVLYKDLGGKYGLMIGIVGIAAPTSTTAMSRVAGCAAITTAGSMTQTAVAWPSPTRM